MRETSGLTFKRQIIDESTLRRTMMRLSYEVVEKHGDLNDVVLVGIKRRGIPLAEMIRENIFKNTGVEVDMATLDIKFYRDDLKKENPDPRLTKNAFPVDIDGREVIIVDDVIYTGRTVRAAIEAIFDLGRPSKVSLLVLVDRGHRELPFRPDYVGKNIPTSSKECVCVNIEPIDDRTNVELWEIEND